MYISPSVVGQVYEGVDAAVEDNVELDGVIVDDADETLDADKRPEEDESIGLDKYVLDGEMLEEDESLELEDALDSVMPKLGEEAIEMEAGDKQLYPVSVSTLLMVPVLNSVATDVPEYSANVVVEDGSAIKEIVETTVAVYSVIVSVDKGGGVE